MPALALTNVWKPFALLALVTAVFIYRAVLIHERDSAQAQAKALETQAALLQTSNAALERAIGQQNAAVEALHQQLGNEELQTQRREQEFAQRGAAAMMLQTEQADHVRNAQVPPGCTGAIVWGNAQGPVLGQW